MKPAPLPLTLLVLGLSTVSGETGYDLTCHVAAVGNYRSCTDKQGCCYRQFGPKNPNFGCRSPSAGDESACQKGCWNEGKGVIQCTCANKDNCIGETDNPWGADKVYKDHHAQASKPGEPGSGSSTNHAALLLIVAALGSLPHLF